MSRSKMYCAFPPNSRCITTLRSRLTTVFIASDNLYHQWVRGFVRSVEHVPLLVPENHFTGLKPSAKWTGKVCLGSATHNVLPSNFYTSIVAFKQLRERGHDIEGEIIGVMDRQADRIESYADNVDNLTVKSFMKEDFYNYLPTFDLALIPTARVSTGRLSAEFAAAGVPCVGNGRNEYQKRCFPDLCVHPFDTRTIITLAHRLLTDNTFYNRMRDQAQFSVSALESHETYRENLKSFVEMIEYQ